MPDALQLEVVTLEREVIRDSASEVQLPGAAGYLGILPGHTPLLTEVGIGVLSYQKAGQTFYAAVIGGMAEVLADRVTVLAQIAERPEEIDVAKARDRLAVAPAAAAATAASGADVDWDQVQRSLAGDQARLEAAAHAASVGSPHASS
jgi:F-type H+-transporting ATPase subunit epsilon